MAAGSVIAIAVGLIAAIPTVIAGLIDLFGISAGTPACTAGWWHLAVMATATGMFIGTLHLQLAGYSNGQIITSALALGLISEALLIVGGYLGGVLAFVYGVRVLKLPQTPIADALIPGRAGDDK
jgi:uncharacterized membrane protein